MLGNKGFGEWSSLFLLIDEIYFQVIGIFYWQCSIRDLDCSRCQQTRHANNNNQTTTMRPEPELIEAYLLGRIGTICPFTDGLLVDAWECGFIHAMNAK
jgi:hypothetical protein